MTATRARDPCPPKGLTAALLRSPIITLEHAALARQDDVTAIAGGSVLWLGMPREWRSVSARVTS